MSQTAVWFVKASSHCSQDTFQDLTVGIFELFDASIVWSRHSYRLKENLIREKLSSRIG